MKKILSGIIIGTVLPSILLTTFASMHLFKDVALDAWYASSVDSLNSKGIMRGYKDGTFKPGAYVTRAEMAKALDNVLEYVEKGHVESDEDIADMGTFAAYKGESSFKLNVPFTSQAPNSDWNMPYQEACEEASLIMVKYFLNQKSLDAGLANDEILALVKWEEENGFGVDVGAAQILEIAKNYYGLNGNVFYDEAVTIDSIKKSIASGNPVIVPVAGQLLGNPNFVNGGPPYHVIVIVGFDDEHFITNDPGTHAGESYKYTFATIDAAIHDWNGSKQSIESGKRAMVVLF